MGQPRPGAGRRDQRRLREPGLSERGQLQLPLRLPDVDTADEPEVDVESNRFPTTRAPRTRPSPVRPAQEAARRERPASRTPVYHLVRRRRSHTPRRRQPRPRHRPGLPWPVEPHFWGPGGRRHGAETREEPRQAAAMSCEEACGLLGPAPRQAGAPSPPRWWCLLVYPLGSSGLWGRPWPGGGLEVFSERAFKQ